MLCFGCEKFYKFTKKVDRTNLNVHEEINTKFNELKEKKCQQKSSEKGADLDGIQHVA